MKRDSKQMERVYIYKNGELSQGQRLEEDAVPSSSAPFSRLFLAFETCARLLTQQLLLLLLSLFVLQSKFLYFSSNLIQKIKNTKKETF